MGATIKQQRAASKLVENGGNIGKAMIAAGYSKATAKTPQKLTKSKGWQALMDRYYSDTALAKKHAQLLEATTIKYYTFRNSISNKQIKNTIEQSVPGSKVIIVQRNSEFARVHFSLPDNNTQFKSLELGYKVRGKMQFKDKEDQKANQELEAVVLRIRKILPASGQ